MSPRETYRSSASLRQSKVFSLALGAAREAARMQGRGDYNYARLGQIDSDIDAWVGRYSRHGRLRWPAEIWAARHDDTAACGCSAISVIRASMVRS